MKDFIRLLVKTLKEFEDGLAIYAVALATFKKSHPAPARLLDDLIVRLKAAGVPHNPHRAVFDISLENALRRIPQSTQDSEWTRLAESLPKGWVN